MALTVRALLVCSAVARVSAAAVGSPASCLVQSKVKVETSLELGPSKTEDQPTDEAMDFEDKGCWKNRVPQRLESLEWHPRLGGDFRNRLDAIIKCFEVAMDLEYNYFGVGGGGKCWGADGESDNIYGSTPCSRNSDGKGSYGVVHVYEVKGVSWCELGESHTMCKYPAVNSEQLCGEIVARTITDQDKADILHGHNELRRVAKLPDLVWDNNLAAVAQRWADQCQNQHDKNRATPILTHVGQQLHLGVQAQASNSWESVVEGFAPQVLAGRTHIGCGHTRYLKDGNQYSLFVCNYGQT